MEEFVNLHNRTVSRSEVERVISIAKEQNNTEVIYRTIQPLLQPLQAHATQATTAKPSTKTDAYAKAISL